MRVEIDERIGFEPRTQTPGTVLTVPGDATPEEAADWIARGLAHVLEETPLPALVAAPHKGERKEKRS
ncbi:MAG: hypothetical protein WC969_14730 [Elusimicrobiota bacterium]